MLPLRILGVSLVSAVAVQPQSDEEGVTAPSRQKHWWPHCHGHVGAYGHTHHVGPPSLKGSLKWTWHSPTWEVMLGSLVDHEKNIYVTNVDGIRKFSPQGTLLWHFYPPRPAQFSKAPSLMGDAIYGDLLTGHVFALDINTGKLRWSTKAFTGVSEGDTAYVEAHDGVVITIFDQQYKVDRVGNVRIIAANASDGSKLWEFASEVILWNFKATFLDDGTFLTYDVHGGIQRISTSDGSLVWRTNLTEHNIKFPANASFSDGGVTVTPDKKIAFTCANLVHGEEGTPGILRAYAVEDGQPLWQQVLPFPCVSWPAVEPSGQEVVVVIGSFQQSWKPCPVGVMKFKALTGGTVWNFFEMPPLFGPGAKGDPEHVEERTSNRDFDRDGCGPASWSAPIIDGNGTIYASNHVGHLYAINDFNQNRVIEQNEYEVFDVNAASLHCGAGFAPGMMVFATCDTVFVWEY